ncbi:MAG: hypothetical protein ACFFD9_04125 [Candidatus Thorarchaeota archaeon]
MNDDEELLSEVEKRFLRRHWRMTIVFAVVFVVAVIAALLVFLWVVGNAQTTGLVPALLGQWTVGYLITFILHVIFWELAFVVSWLIIVAAAIYFLWYKQLPEEERAEWPKRGRREEGDAIGFFVAVFWLIIVWIDGRWDRAFEAWTLDEWVYSWIAAIFWVFLVFGIPVAIYFLWWISKEMKEEPQRSTETVEEVADEPSEV